MPIIKDFKTIPELFHIIAVEFGKGKDKPALKYKDKDKWIDIKYDQLYEKTELLACGLASMGVKKDDKVAIISENRPEWVYADMAILGLGAIDVPLYPISTSDSIEFILNNSEAVGIFVSNKFHLNKILKIKDKCKHLKFVIVMNNAEKSPDKGVYSFEDILNMGKEFRKENPGYFKDKSELVEENQLCTIIYTSGTTGEPKGVMLTHKNIVSNIKAAHEIFDIDETDTFLSFLPLCHIFERMAGYYTAFSCGGTIAYAESIEKIASNMLEIRPTIMTAVPRLFERMYTKIKRNIESQSEKKQKIFNWAIETGKEYQLARKSGQPIPVSLTLKHKLADKLVLSKLRERTGGRMRFFISGGAALARELGIFFEAAGILIIEGYGLTESSPVIAANRLNDYKFGTVGKPMPGVEVKIAKDGEILAHGPNIMQGYYKNKKETEETIKDGWLHTGDIGVFDAEGFLIITDRKKHLFKTSQGKYVAPTPIESMFLASKYIEQFVIIGDRRMFITALIVPDFEALKEYADANRIQYKDEKELVKMKQIYELLDKELEQFQKKLSSFEKVRKFTLLDKPFTIEDGELTPSLKVKRKVIEERYRDLIDEMYKGLEG
ncbi:Long-chain acyl-CoA synthetase [Melioribacter roseus P3M-2]|uniref:Long-chain acyl-CoA synthetase n=1 Tax=Melioribacter roseus (strain DSM 23840 / JCM 17771 / VKM B-2668 / P3M-2) TaxID=1191523 RepID=I6ZN72_MELRP|nr:long-chain fatty acid--CoA ligase [Melioribacter roseus]AFN73419.1 Long-chain acyl-CoA synthetase [Melioribacter roseus P3M-2]